MSKESDEFMANLAHRVATLHVDLGVAQDAIAELVGALATLVNDWNSLGDQQVPEEINVNAHWEQANRVLAKYRTQGEGK